MIYIIDVEREREGEGRDGGKNEGRKGGKKMIDLCFFTDKCISNLLTNLGKQNILRL